MLKISVGTHFNAAEETDGNPDARVGVVGDVAVGTAADFLAERSVRREEQDWRAHRVGDNVVTVLGGDMSIREQYRRVEQLFHTMLIPNKWK